eukprot:TRINITY_DN17750_c0_g1_i1.p3 TRINITY_DN17750_c0_g1~~TRINITY_DN17750_c0_g1_i1.p3  ORF type:complete len:324 (+),score=90.00 TRINITY_DN17750_c0_g1_i1:85-972(+)
MTAALRDRFPERMRDARADGPAPAPLVQELEEALDKAMRNISGPTNLDGHRWELDKKVDGGVEVYGSKANNSTARRFLVKGKAPKGDPELVYTWLVQMGNKCKWDKESVGWWSQAKSFSGSQKQDRIDIEIYTSLPAAGGLVKPRAFCDARLTRWRDDGSIVSIVMALEGAWLKQWDLPEFERLAKAGGILRARNVPGGCGVHLIPDGEGTLIRMAAQSEMGGWLPASTVNQATAPVLGGIALGAIRRVTSEHARAPPPPKATEAAAPPGERRRRRIRPPGCTDTQQYSWRWHRA